VKLGKENVMKGVDRFIKKTNADMLVLAKHNRPFFDRIFHRSLSKRMAYHTDIPLLVLNK
jgi:nucleotide-binding universal stress UspA family protein